MQCYITNNFHGISGMRGTSYLPPGVGVGRGRSDYVLKFVYKTSACSFYWFFEDNFISLISELLQTPESQFLFFFFCGKDSYPSIYFMRGSQGPLLLQGSLRKRGMHVEELPRTYTSKFSFYPPFRGKILSKSKQEKKIVKAFREQEWTAALCSRGTSSPATAQLKVHLHTCHTLLARSYSWETI